MTLDQVIPICSLDACLPWSLPFSAQCPEWSLHMQIRASHLFLKTYMHLCLCTWVLALPVMGTWGPVLLGHSVPGAHLPLPLPWP